MDSGSNFIELRLGRLEKQMEALVDGLAALLASLRLPVPKVEASSAAADATVTERLKLLLPPQEDERRFTEFIAALKQLLNGGRARSTHIFRSLGGQRNAVNPFSMAKALTAVFRELEAVGLAASSRPAGAKKHSPPYWEITESGRALLT